MCLVAEAFFGYLLPGKLSYWGRASHFNLFSTILFIGLQALDLDSGAESVLNLHVIPLVLIGLVPTVALHEVNLNNFATYKPLEEAPAECSKWVSPKVLRVWCAQPTETHALHRFCKCITKNTPVPIWSQRNARNQSFLGAQSQRDAHPSWGHRKALVFLPTINASSLLAFVCIGSKKRIRFTPTITQVPLK